MITNSNRKKNQSTSFFVLQKKKTEKYQRLFDLLQDLETFQFQHHNGHEHPKILDKPKLPSQTLPNEYS